MRQGMTISAAYIRQSLTAAVLLLCVSVSAQAQPSQTAVQDAAGADYRSEPRGLIAEPVPIERAIVFADRHFGNGELRKGFYTDFFNMIPGAGWISGIGAHHTARPRPDLPPGSSAPTNMPATSDAPSSGMSPRQTSIDPQLPW